MFKAVLIGAILAFANSLRVANQDKQEHLVEETNQAHKIYISSGSVSIVDCVGKNNGEACGFRLRGTCLTCDGYFQCKYWGKCWFI